MKRLFAIILALSFLLSFCACTGSGYTKVDLKKAVAIPEDGIIKKDIFEQVKEENAIATFTGISNGIAYEWTVFGSELSDTRDVNFSISLEKEQEGILLIFEEVQDFGFPALLSLQLDEKWTAPGATAYHEEEVAYSVSITGSKTSILNLSVNKMVGECMIRPNEIKETETASDRLNSDGNSTEKDKYLTDPVPEGKPLPVEPENQEINQKQAYTCIFSIECSTILNNLAELDPDKLELVPPDGVILEPTTVTFYEGESVFDVLQRICKEKDIHLEFSWTPVYNSAYIEGIHNLYEFDCGSLSGWMYSVNNWYPNYGCSRYQLADGEIVEWRYTCDLGMDVGRDGTW